MCLACRCSHSSRLLALMWFARWVLIKGMGSTTRDPKKGSPASTTDRINIMPSAPPQFRDALRRVPLALALQSCAPPHDHLSPSHFIRQPRARLRSILGGAVAGLVDAAVDHDGPGDPRGLIGDRNRRLLGRHAAEQLRDPGMLVRAFLRLLYNGHRAVNE